MAISQKKKRGRVSQHGPNPLLPPSLSPPHFPRYAVLHPSCPPSLLLRVCVWSEWRKTGGQTRVKQGKTTTWGKRSLGSNPREKKTHHKALLLFSPICSRARLSWLVHMRGIHLNPLFRSQAIVDPVLAGRVDEGGREGGRDPGLESISSSARLFFWVVCRWRANGGRQARPRACLWWEG